ncbi:hypothetical protein [Halalkalibacter nanhaiisediminis]|uniref:Uncharacterized protein n=1 Tax=Halalkalibacter nanhaiisediminis TaxID=688079 RepID=A0A562QT15_9BACI|nr:hypothetical protein [Halalkalibacter nanhaiisediminis]TWI59908.1 hypothetical protein IQ10_00331 [Halalkalibacter nanhaiisediminis]
MMPTQQWAVKSKNRSMQVGDRVVVTNSIKNGLIELKPMDSGVIVYLEDQSRATVWFRHFGCFVDDPIIRVLQVYANNKQNGNLDGMTVELEKESLAIEYKDSQREDFYHITVWEDKALDIPFFQVNNKYRVQPSIEQKNAQSEWEPMYKYDLWQIIDIIEYGFNEWIKEVVLRDVLKEGKEVSTYLNLSDESCKEIDAKKKELELACAKATGVFYDFAKRA